MDSTINCLCVFGLREQETLRNSHEASAVVSFGEATMMKYVFLIVFLVVIFGGAVTTRTRSAAPAIVTALTPAESYAKHCASCHGKDGRAKTFKAKMNHARNLTDAEWQERVSDERIFNSIMNGKGKMPGYAKKLSAKEIDALVTYVRGLKK